MVDDILRDIMSLLGISEWRKTAHGAIRFKWQGKFYCLMLDEVKNL